MNEKSSTSVSIEFTGKTDKKHSTRWDAADKDAVMSTVYIRKPDFMGAKRIRITIEVVE